MRNSQLTDLRVEWVEPALIPPDSVWHTLDHNPLVAAILYRRGIRTQAEAQAFLRPGQVPLADPYAIPNMSAAIARLRMAITARETIGIFGDYDVDGITSAAIMTLALGHTGNPVITRLPNRAEGYGLNPDAIREFREAGVSLVVAVDCASTDHVNAALVLESGMDLVIFDHHHMADTGPAGAITVSPQLNGDGTYHDLTAAGVAWLAASALSADGQSPVDLLDLAALGTVADVAPLTGVNRQLVAGGVERMRTHPRPGLLALFANTNISASSLTASNIAFNVAPRLNAAGRLDSPNLAYDLLLCTDLTRARSLATHLEQVNLRRKTRSAQLHAEALTSIQQQPGWESQPVFAVAGEGWEAGLVGAVASRLTEEVGRPVFMFRREHGQLTGSARSIEGLNLVETLAEAGEILTRFGGHSLAAGVTLPEANLPALEAHLAAAIIATGVPFPAPKRHRIDARLPAEYLTIETVNELARMEPFGRGNEQPLLLVPNADLMRYSVMGQDRSHLKIQARSGGRPLEAVAWGAAARSRELVGVRTVDLVGRLEINRWNGQERLQMVLEDFRPTP